MAEGSQIDRVIVVGGGILGVSIAYNLALHEAIGEVTLIERGQVNKIDLSNTIATIEPFSQFPSVATLQSYSIGVYTGSRDTGGLDLGYSYAPMAMLVGEEDIPVLHKIMEVSHASANHFTTLSPQEFARRVPNANLEGIAAVGFSEDSGYINPRKAVQQYLNAALRLRVKVLEEVSVEKVLTSGDRVTGVQTSDGDYYADVVVLAVGSWTGQLLASLGMPNPLEDRIHFMTKVVLDSPGEYRPLSYSIRDMKSGFYVYPAGSGQYVIGSMHWQATKTLDDLDSDAKSIDEAVIEEIRTQVNRRFPSFQAAKIKLRWPIIWDVSPDKQPLIGPVPGLDGLYMAAGTSSMGFKIAPAVGVAIPALMTGDEAMMKLFEDLKPERIQNNDLLTPPDPFHIHKEK